MKPACDDNLLRFLPMRNYIAGTQRKMKESQVKSVNNLHQEKLRIVHVREIDFLKVILL